MRHAIALLLAILMASTSFAAISLKGGLAGGGFQIGISADRPINQKTTITGDAGYSLGNSYNVIAIGGTAKYLVRENLSAGLNLSYSSYSAAVNLPGTGNLSSGGGVGVGLFAEVKIREGLYGQIGYDTRLGTLAGVSYIVRK